MAQAMAIRAFSSEVETGSRQSRPILSERKGFSSQRKLPMSASEIAHRHFAAAVAEAENAELGADSLCRALLGLVVSKYLEDRAVADVQSELRFVADNCDPDTDFAFMRP